MTDWVELHRLNRLWRAWMDRNSKFVTPDDALDTLRYLSEECHEARKCWMVEQLPHHPRRQAPDKTIRQEFAQAIMLGLTALPVIDFTEAENDCLARSDLQSIDNICDLANDAVVNRAQGFDYWTASAHALLMAIDAWPGFNANTELRLCWSALAWKHASQHMHEYPEELAPVRDEVLIGPANAEVRVAFARAEVQP